MPLRLEDIMDRLVPMENDDPPKLPYENGKIEGSIVTIEVKGVEVSGEITQRLRQFMEVTMLSPYPGVVGQTGHIPIFALKYHDTFGLWGDNRAMSILYNICEFCCFAKEHKEELAQCLDRYNTDFRLLSEDNEERSQIQQEINGLWKQRSAIKTALKAGEMSSKEYKSKLMPLKEKLCELRNSLVVEPRTVFESAFSDFLETPVRNIDMFEVMKFIETLDSPSS